MIFHAKSPVLKVLKISLATCQKVEGFDAKQCHVFQSPCFKLKQSDSQKAYGFDCLADDSTDMMNW